MNKNARKNIAIWTVAGLGIFFSLGTGPLDFGATVNDVAYAPAISFNISAGESITYKVSHVCQAAYMPNGEPYSVLTTGRIDASVPGGSTTGANLEVTYRNQADQTNVQSLNISPGMPAQLVSGIDIFLDWSSGDTCAFTGWVTIAHTSGDSVSGMMTASGTLSFDNAPSGVDINAINYQVSASVF